MVRVLASKINLNKSAEEINRIMTKVPQRRRDKAARFKFDNDRIRCLAAYLLATFAICSFSGCESGDIKIARGEYGKPELIYPKGCFFNISHSGDYVVCAVSDKPVGIDIQEKSRDCIDIAQRYFAPDEYKYIINLPEDLRLGAFYEIWSLKESYIKALGMGLHKSLGSFQIMLSNGEIAVKDSEPQQLEWKLSRFCLENDYFLAVTASDIAGEVEFIDETLILKP